MAALDDSLEQWTSIESSIPMDNRGLLIGNGCSRALWPPFEYESLLAMASDPTKPEHLSLREQKIFQDMGSSNFEAVLSALIVAGKMWKHFEKPDKDVQDLRDAYSVVRKSLIRAVKEVHVPFDNVNDSVKQRLRDHLRPYEYVYSTNYDLLLYWAMMTEPKQFKDFIWNRFPDTSDVQFDSTNTDLWQERNGPLTKVLFLHGALHFYKGTDGRTFKRVSTTEDANPGRDLLEQFDFRDTAVPLFVSEGTSKDKRAAICRNDYLSFAYERFAKHRGSLIVFGHSLTPDFDQHLIDAMVRWERYDQCRRHDPHRKSSQKIPDKRVIAVSVLPTTVGSDVISLKARLAKALPKYEIRYYDATTHPLAQLND